MSFRYHLYGKLFQIWVKDLDGAEYGFSDKVKLYVQTDVAWKTGGEAVFVTGSADEAVEISEMQMTSPDGQISFVVLDMVHGGYVVLCDAYCDGSNHTYEDAPVFTWSEDNSACKVTIPSKVKKY